MSQQSEHDACGCERVFHEHERLVYIERSLRELKLALANGGPDSLRYAMQLLLALKAFVRTCTGEERAWLARRVAEVRAECAARNAVLVGLLADLERMTVSDGDRAMRMEEG